MINLLNDLDPVRKALFEELMRRADRMNNWGKLRKLASAPLKFIESELSEIIGKILPRKATTFWGETIQVNLPEPVSMGLYRYGYFEEGLSALLLAILRPGGRFLDVGSHYGYFSLLARHLVGSAGVVVALEPTPSTFEANRLNTGRYENIRVENKAAWSSPTTVRLTDLGVAWSSHNSLLEPKMLPAGVKENAKQIEVQCLRLDDFLSEIGFAPDLIKIDAESAELEILKGLSDTLRNLRPVVTLEVGDDVAHTGVRSADAVKFCAEYGYVPFAFVDRAILFHKVQEQYGYDNVFMVPAERVAATGLT